MGGDGYEIQYSGSEMSFRHPIDDVNQRFIYIMELRDNKQFGRSAGLWPFVPGCTPDPSPLSVYPKEAILYESHQLYLLTSGQGYPD